MGSLKKLVAKKDESGMPDPPVEALSPLSPPADEAPAAAPEEKPATLVRPVAVESPVAPVDVARERPPYPPEKITSVIPSPSAPRSKAVTPPAPAVVEVVREISGETERLADGDWEAPAVAPEPGKLGWMSPKYSVSRRVDIDPRKVEENRCVAFRSDAAEVETYRILRTQILQRTAGGGNTIMVTSALPGEGKTLTAINLALTFAREFKQTALLVDCDLKKQQMQDYFGFKGEKGLVDYLLYDCPVSELMIWPGVEKLTIISGGRTIGESTELLGAPRMKELVAEMKQRYPERYIFFDVPAVLGSADALAFAPLVDHILVAIRADRTPVDQVNRALGMLPPEKLFGVVLNGEKKRH